MLQLVKSLDPVKYTPRSYIVANTDILSKEKAILHEQELNKVIQKRGRFFFFLCLRIRIRVNLKSIKYQDLEKLDNLGQAYH